jgi:hypothetical protein
MYGSCTMAGALTLYYRSLETALTLLKMGNILGILYIYITSMINCYLIMLHVHYKQLSSPINDGYVMCISTY